jgi:PadR family transcriptional regulator, regulatory protein PadR
MSSDQRITAQSERIIKLFASDPEAELAGADIERATKIAKGTIYPTLTRMHRRGWLTWRWEEIDPKAEGRPRKRLYKITGQGELAAHAIESQATTRIRQRELKRARLKPAPQGSSI